MFVQIEELKVLFPYDFIYPEQYQYMIYLKQTIDAGGKSILEMPSGTGKTISLLSLIVSYMLNYPSKYTKLVYCTRTVPEVEKVLHELDKLYGYYMEFGRCSVDLLSIGLASRKNMCINQSICNDDPRTIDRKCHSLTSYVTRERSRDTQVELCDYYENFQRDGVGFSLSKSIYSIDKLKNYSAEKMWCPYFLARQSVLNCNILVYSYAYLVDPKVSQIVSKEIEASSIVIFDEAHNIDSACIEAFSLTLDQKIIVASRNAISKLKTLIDQARTTNDNKLKQEYNMLLEGLEKLRTAQSHDIFLPNPTISDEILKEAVPGNIRKAEHFVLYLQRLVEYLAHKMDCRQLVVETPSCFISNMTSQINIDKKSLKFCSERLRSLINILDIDSSTDVTLPLGLIASFATTISSFESGFCVISEPHDPSTPTIFQPKLYLNCMDSSIAIKPVFKRFKCIIITSGTLSPLDMYPRLLDFQPYIVASLGMSLPRPSVFPIIVTRGMDQGTLSSRFIDRYEPGVLKNYGNLVSDVCSVVPDGVVCFFTSYRHMEASILAWSEGEILTKIQKFKLVFIETPNSGETALALDGFKKACDCGRGGLLFSVARGKVSEGIDFYDHLGRVVIVLGVPYVYTLSSILRSRLDYLRDNYSIRERDFLTFDALRHTAQCIGRVIRGKDDYGVMILADERFSKPGKIKKLPKWIQENIKSGNVGISSDDAVIITKLFLKDMGQPLTMEDQLGTCLVSQEYIKSETFQKKLEALHQTSIQNYKLD